jgi:hypothetical protein
MAARRAMQREQIWIGTVEVRLLRDAHEFLGTAKGAFVNIVTWAADADGYRHNVELVVASLGGLFVADVVLAEPVDIRRARVGGHFKEEIEDLIARAQANPQAILYGTFERFDRDDG